MRLAHLVLVHQNPQQAERLIRRLVCADTDIYIHLDGKCDMAQYTHISQLPGVFFIANRTIITWANYSMMRATLTSFEEILGKGIQYSHINLLSGQDYPLKNAEEIKRFLFANADKTFMRYRDVFNDWPETISRFTLYSFGDYNFPLKFKLQKLANKLLPKRKLPYGLVAYGFSQWLTITPACAAYTINYLKSHPLLVRFFRLTWGVDELVFQTVLLNSELKSTVVNDHLRYIKFASRGFSPKILTMEDADLLVNSGKFYARKFDADTDSRIFDYLDSVALAK